MKALHLLFLGLLTSQSYAADTTTDTYFATRLAGIPGVPGFQDGGLVRTNPPLDNRSMVDGPSMALGISPGRFIFTDTDNNAVREWYNGTVTTPNLSVGLDHLNLNSASEDGSDNQEIFDMPSGIAKIFDRFLVANTNKNCIEVLRPTHDGYFVETLKKANGCPYSFEKPVGLCFDDDDGSLYVVESAGARISKVNMFTKTREVIAGAGAHEAGYYDDHPHHRHRDDRHLINLDNLDVDDRDQDDSQDGYDSDQDSVYSEASETVHRDGPGHRACFHGPLHITKVKGAEGTTFYLTDDVNNAIRTIKKEADGEYTVGTLALTGEAIINPNGITSRDGKLYVTTDNKVVEIDTATNIATKIYGTGQLGVGDGELQNPRGVAVVDVGNGEIDLIVLDQSRIQKLQKQVPNVDPNDPVPGRGGTTAGGRSAAAGSAAESADSGDDVGEQNFRFGLSPEQVKLTMRQRINFGSENNGNDVYAKALSALEKTVDSTQAVKQIGKGMTFWISGLYTQGQTDAMLGNPAMTDKHGGIIAGTHYKDAATQQIIGVALDVGIGNSISKIDKDLKSDNRSAQLTVYYNKTFNKNWKFNVHTSFMRSMDRHQRPFVDNNGNKLIAISNGITHEYATTVELSYKHEFSKDNYLKPFVASSYTLTKQFGYQEKNADIYNRSFGDASMNQIGVQFGLKSSIGFKISDTKNFVIMPKISYTNFVKMGMMTQTSINISSGQASVGKAGTPGRHLFSGTLGIGIADYEANTTTRLAYTGNIQAKRKSHEVMLDWGMKF